MPDPSEYLRPCQRDHGVPDLHDIPERINADAIHRYIDKSGRERAHMARNRIRFPRYHDLYLRQHRGAHIVSLASLAVIAERKDLTK